MPSTPLPLQVPPSGVALKVIGRSVKHSVEGTVPITAVTPGNTVIVKVLDAPVQPLADGVTVIVATNGAAVVLVTMNGAILPVPDAANPIAVLLLVQL